MWEAAWEVVEEIDDGFPHIGRVVGMEMQRSRQIQEELRR